MTAAHIWGSSTGTAEVVIHPAEDLARPDHAVAGTPVAAAVLASTARMCR